MNPTLRLSVIAVLMLAVLALGLTAYNMSLPKQEALLVKPDAPAPLMVSYLVAAHPLPAGTLAREEDFTARAEQASKVPSGVIVDTPDARVGLRGSLVRKFLETGMAVTSDDVLRPRDRGFLASVLQPGTRAISINVDAETSVSGLIWPGDHVDVVLTHDIKNANLAHGTVSETILHDVRIIGIDQEIVQGAPSNNASAGKVAKTVTLQVAPDQVEVVTTGEHLGKLSLAMRSAVEQAGAKVSVPVFSGDVSPAIAHEGAAATVTVYEGGQTPKQTEYSFKAGGR
jgi:pilus assembly protein CpaB